MQLGSSSCHPWQSKEMAPCRMQYTQLHTTLSRMTETNQPNIPEKQHWPHLTLFYGKIILNSTTWSYIEVQECSPLQNTQPTQRIICSWWTDWPHTLHHPNITQTVAPGKRLITDNMLQWVSHSLDLPMDLHQILKTSKSYCNRPDIKRNSKTPPNAAKNFSSIVFCMMLAEMLSHNTAKDLSIFHAFFNQPEWEHIISTPLLKRIL